MDGAREVFDRDGAGLERHNPEFTMFSFSSPTGG
jgi:hypothetical protein